jgi:hypothetical protein
LFIIIIIIDFSIRKKRVVSGTHWTGSWVGPRAGLNVEEKFWEEIIRLLSHISILFEVLESSLM